jgi:molybdopterin/thiamine biosynthesis adenylyltransferase
MNLESIGTGIDPVLLWRKKLGFQYSKEALSGPLGLALNLIGDSPINGPELTSSLIMPIPVLPHTRICVAIVGCGGTGSHLVPNVIQYLASRGLTNKTDCSTPDIFLIDGDKVEERNLLRQKFTKFEVGEYKSKALATRYSDAWEYPVSYYTGYVDRNSLLELFGSNPSHKYDLFIILGAVDNHAARLEISSYLRTINESQSFSAGVYWVDGGNEASHGQAILSGFPHRHRSSSYEWEVNKNIADTWESASIGSWIKPYKEFPCFFARNPAAIESVLTESSERKQSCLELSEEDPQTIQANMMSAYCMTSLLTQIITGRIASTSIHFDSITGNTSSRFITKKNILEDITMIENTKTLIEEAKLTVLNKKLNADLNEEKVEEDVAHDDSSSGRMSENVSA